MIMMLTDDKNHLPVWYLMISTYIRIEIDSDDRGLDIRVCGAVRNNEWLNDEDEFENDNKRLRFKKFSERSISIFERYI